MPTKHTSLLYTVTMPLASAMALLPGAAFAQVFNGNGDGLQTGVNEASNITGLAKGDVRGTIIRILETVLNFLALLATAMVIIAGFYLVLSLGDDERKEKAKKIIYYTLIGLVVILFSRIIVSLITEVLASQVQ